MISFGDTITQNTDPEPAGAIKGVVTAIVTDNKDPEGLGRVKLKYPWNDKKLADNGNRCESNSNWARVATPMAGKDRGLVLIPEVGDEVLVAFERDDVRFPFVLGALWNGVDRPPERNSSGKNDKRIFKSRKKHHLLMDDGARGVVELRHEKGRKITFDDDGFVIQDELGNKIKIDSNSGTMTIESKGPLKIKAMSISIEASGAVDIKAGATLSIRGSMVNIN